LVRLPLTLKAVQLCACQLRHGIRRRRAQRTTIARQFSLGRMMGSITLLCGSAAIVAAQLQPGHANRLAIAIAAIAFWAAIFNFFGRVILLLGTLLLTVVLGLLISFT
jgi:hypothetical protein